MQNIQWSYENMSDTDMFSYDHLKGDIYSE